MSHRDKCYNVKQDKGQEMIKPASVNGQRCLCVAIIKSE